MGDSRCKLRIIQYLRLKYVSVFKEKLNIPAANVSSDNIKIILIKYNFSLTGVSDWVVNRGIKILLSML